jgi:MFS family permease
MTIPGTALSVGFNALFAEAVPTDWRGHVTGIRNAVLAVAFIVATLISGQILARVAFPLNYQIVFAIGLLGAVMSSAHLAFVKPVGAPAEAASNWHNLGDLASPGRLRGAVGGLRTSVGLRFLVSKQRVRSLLRFEILLGPFGPVLLGLFAFHLAQYLAIPLFPLVWVNDLDFSDDVISAGQALFYVAVFIGSTQLSRLVKRFGNQRITAAGVVMLGLYPAISAVMQGPPAYLLVSLLGGAAWSLVGGGIANYILDRTPTDDRPAHLAWYNLALNAAILLGSLGGPLLAEAVGITAALFIAAIARALSGVYIWRRG